MSGLKRILAAVDGSETAGRGLQFAMERAKLHGATLGLAYAVNRTSVAMAMSDPYGYVDPTPMLDAIDDEADALLDAGISTAKAFDVLATAVKLEGPPADAIVERAKETHADLVVAGTHGRRGIGRLLIGSVAEGVTRACSAPVFVIPQDGSTVGPLNRALVCIDGSPASETALAFALEIAEVERTRLILCTVVEPEAKAHESLDRAYERAKGIPAVECRLLHGNAVAEITSFAQRWAADCIFTGTHGRAGIPRLILGSVALGLLQSNCVPVCTVRHR